MATLPSFNITFNEDSNSVSSSLYDWANLIKKQEHLQTREVLVEKYNRRKDILRKWDSVGFFTELKGHANSNIAMLLESQASSMLNEQIDINSKRPFGISSKGFKKETIFSKIKSFFVRIWNKVFKKKKQFNDSTINWDNIAFPLVRRVAAQTVSLDLVSVQPLSLPNGLLTYLDFKFEEPENVYSKKVLFEKHKSIYIRKYPYSTNSVTQDFFMPEEIFRGH